MLKFSFKTLGCKVNQAESESLSAQLEEAGLTPAKHMEAADFCIINTCTVTQRAAMQSRQAIRQAIRANPAARLMVTGCYAQTAPEEIRRIDGIDTILGHNEKPRLVEFALESNCNSDVRCQARIQKKIALDRPYIIKKGIRTRPFLKIQDGCEAFCTYCIVPYARGPSRSLPTDKVIECLDDMKRSGFREIVLTGIHLGNYGLDLTPQSDLLSLLKRIRLDSTIDRIRLSSIEPGEISDALIECVANSTSGVARICPHFHIPLQSGDDDILKKMHRPYTSELFKNLVLKINQLIPDSAIGVDILVGFPGESEAAFNRTCLMIEQLPVSYLHVFPFSPREGTPAYHFPDKVPPDLIRQRCRIIREIGNRKRFAFYQKFIDRQLEVILEKRQHTPPGYMKGTSANYIPVLIEECDDLSQENEIIKVRVKKVGDDLDNLKVLAMKNGIHKDEK
jgi:threonylcarbamoyladenosine tRNA methylthiotransferase MtaB